MNDIEREIEELEELIRLQRLKCDLLHRKNSRSDSSDPNNTRKKSSVLEISDEKEEDEKEDVKVKSGDVTMNILHGDKSDHDNSAETSREKTKSSEGIGTRITENVRHMIMSTTSFQGDESVRSSVVTKNEDTGGQDKKTEEKLITSTDPPPPPAPVKETKEDRFVNAITRLSRLNTDLANERNLLAWARTALAAARTFLAFIGVTATTDFGNTSRQICYLGFGVMSIYIILQGAERYNKIKKIVYLKNPPPNFDRLTNAPLPVCLSLLFGLGLMSVCFDQWEN